MTVASPICFGETIIDGRIPDELIEDFLARKIGTILGESAKADGAIFLGAGVPGSVANTEMAADPFAGHSCLRPLSFTGKAQTSPKA